MYAAFVAAAVIVLRARFAARMALRRTSGGYLLVAGVAWAVAYSVTIVGHLLLSPVLGPWSSTGTLLLAIGSDDGRLAHAEPMLMVIVLGRACLLAPVGEELLFRGALFSWLRQHVSAAWTIAITAAAFALIHGYPPLILLGFILGLASGWVRECSGSVVPTVVLHVFHNIVMVAFSYAATGWTARLPAWGHG